MLAAESAALATEAAVSEGAAAATTRPFAFGLNTVPGKSYPGRSQQPFTGKPNSTDSFFGPVRREPFRTNSIPNYPSSVSSLDSDIPSYRGRTDSLSSQSSLSSEYSSLSSRVSLDPRGNIVRYYPKDGPKVRFGHPSNIELANARTNVRTPKPNPNGLHDASKIGLESGISSVNNDLSRRAVFNSWFGKAKGYAPSAATLGAGALFMSSVFNYRNSNSQSTSDTNVTTTYVPPANFYRQAYPTGNV